MQRIAVRAVPWIAVLLVGTSCASSKPTARPDGATPVVGNGNVTALPVPPLCTGRSLLSALLARGPLPPANPVVIPGSMVSEVKGAKADPAFMDAYRKVAPATVLIQTQAGSTGTGVVVHPGGFVLTNNHVIDNGLQPDLSMKVSVYFGTLDARGRMVRDAKPYEGVVYKYDRLRDLALVKVLAPPSPLVVVPLATKEARPGQPVAAIGNAGIGLLWAMKGCQVSAIGEAARDRAAFAIDCDQMVDRSLSDRDNDQARRECRAQLQAAMAVAEGEARGLIIQTDCAVAPGDSGGPLINAGGELVGLNEGVSVDPTTSVSTAYHVHGESVRDFLAAIPAHPAYAIPDPFCDGGVKAEGGDADLDGKIDTILFQGEERQGFLLDLDQDAFPRAGELHGSDHMPFDAEVALLELEEGRFVFYDTDNDGRFDLMLRAGENGEAITAFTLGLDGGLTPLPELAPKALLDLDLIRVEELKPRFSAIAENAIADSASTPAMRAAAPRDVVPDPIWGPGRKGVLTDQDGDGLPDSLSMESLFSRGLLVDTDQDSLGRLKLEDDPQSLINDRAIDAEISIIRQAGKLWTFYDTDNDGTFDKALLGGSARSWSVVRQAWTRKDGVWTIDTDHIGQLPIQAALVGMPRSAAILGAELEAGRPFPFPNLRDERLSYEELESRQLPGRLYLARGDGQEVFVGDLLGASPRTQDADPKDELAQGRLVTDFALFVSGTDAWIYYDTDGDRAFDLVFFGQEGGGKVVAAYRRSTDGTLTPEPRLVGGAMVQPALLVDEPRQAALRQIATALFRGQAIGD